MIKEATYPSPQVTDPLTTLYFSILVLSFLKYHEFPHLMYELSIRALILLSCIKHVFLLLRMEVKGLSPAGTNAYR